MKTAPEDRRGEVGVFWRRQAAPGQAPPPASNGSRPVRRHVWLLLVAVLAVAMAFGLLGRDPEDRSAPPADRTPASTPTPFEEDLPEVPEISVPREERGGCPEGCEEPRPGCAIKGNVSLDTGERIYHLPGQGYYKATEIEAENGERWFCTEREARANGWRKSRR